MKRFQPAAAILPAATPALSSDGIGKIEVEGASIAELFEPKAPKSDTADPDAWLDDFNYVGSQHHYAWLSHGQDRHRWLANRSLPTSEKNLGNSAAVIRSDKKRIALLQDRSGWEDPYAYRLKLLQPMDSHRAVHDRQSRRKGG